VGAVVLCRLGLPATQLCFTLAHLSLLFSADSIFDRRHSVGSVLAEPFEVEVFYELPERHFPGLLTVVVLLAELFRVHSQLASHLDMSVRKVVTLPRVDPSLHFLIRLLLLCHSNHLVR